MYRVVLLSALLVVSAIAQGNNPKAQGRHDNGNHYGQLKHKNSAESTVSVAPVVTEIPVVKGIASEAPIVSEAPVSEDIIESVTAGFSALPSVALKNASSEEFESRERSRPRNTPSTSLLSAHTNAATTPRRRS
ncbi:hypothetical protein QR680_016145 [Steinernema hermaphroditum]|uniref:Uncharacterized protein n=1 Tax=Steinernema hermaphroditum TaxID=289476 RepID=A0AA39HA76_9BILA|nr:hypothetical protein QR680_016145 [Steinernema hermaphroditum]